MCELPQQLKLVGAHSITSGTLSIIGASVSEPHSSDVNGNFFIYRASMSKPCSSDVNVP